MAKMTVRYIGTSPVWIDFKVEASSRKEAIAKVEAENNIAQATDWQLSEDGNGVDDWTLDCVLDDDDDEEVVDETEDETPARLEDPWNLYTSMPGWEKISAELSGALTETVAATRRSIASGATKLEAANFVYAAMRHLMDLHSCYGASDTEPRDYLLEQIVKEFLVDRNSVR